MVLADGGYRDGGVFAKTPTGLNNDEQRVKKLAIARHETVNKRLKQFNNLANVYRCNLEDHGYNFRAIAIVTQIAIQSEEPYENTFGII
jgi:hypothetical protein